MRRHRDTGVAAESAANQAAYRSARGKKGRDRAYAETRSQDKRGLGRRAGQFSLSLSLVLMPMRAAANWTHSPIRARRPWKPAPRPRYTVIQSECIFLRADAAFPWPMSAGLVLCDLRNLRARDLGPTLMLSRRGSKQAAKGASGLGR